MKQWRIKRAITICGQHKLQDDEVKNRFQRRGWELGLRTHSVEQALLELSKGKASVVIIEDSKKLPAPWVLRQLFSHRLGVLTPTICRVDETQGEKSCYGSIGIASILEEPVSPSYFVEAFEGLIQRWSQQGMAQIHQAWKSLVTGQQTSAIKTLTACLSHDDPYVVNLAGPCLALFFRSSNLKVAERILLQILAKHKKNTGITLSLVDLYLHSAMPTYASRLLRHARTYHNDPLCLIPDQIQTHLMLNQIPESIELTQQLITHDYLKEFAESILPRLYFAEGLQGEFNRFFKAQKDQIQKYELAWNQPFSEKKAG